MKRAPLPPVVAAMYRLGHHVDARPLVPNLVGIRAVRARLDLDKDVDPFESLTDRFDDYVGLVFHDGIMWREFLFRGTTDPGNLAVPGQRGTAVMQPGQYVDAYMLGDHRARATSTSASTSTGPTATATSPRKRWVPSPRDVR
jgi:hypothetical protein